MCFYMRKSFEIDKPLISSAPGEFEWNPTPPYQFHKWESIHIFSYEVSNSMLVFLRIHLRVSSWWTFLFRRHNVCYPSRKFFANNSIYNKARSFIFLRPEVQVSCYPSPRFFRNNSIYNTATIFKVLWICVS